jgi:cobalt-zinc-cadmium efflux system outer membrane protein
MFIKKYALMLLCINSLFAQNILKVDINKADSIFLAKNYYLIASMMNIEAKKAQEIQAKLYPNPNFTIDLNAIDNENNKYFHIGNTGQKVFIFEQLLSISGKRKAEIEIAKTNTEISILEFQKLTNSLKFRLHSDLYSIGQQAFLIEKYNKQLNLLDTLLSAYESQANKGNIALKEVVRLKGAYLKLNNDRAALLKEYFETQARVQALLQTSSKIEFDFNEKDVAKYINVKTLDELKQLALQKNPDFKLAESEKKYYTQLISYEKKSALPDINLFTSYDQRGGAFNNQINAGLSMPLPVWNRNQGNIKAAKFKSKEYENLLNAQENELLRSIENHFQLYSQTVLEYQKAQKLYNEDFEITIKGMTDNFQKRNISIIEFIGFFEAYNEVLTEIVRIKIQLVTSGEQLNLLTASEVF